MQRRAAAAYLLLFLAVGAAAYAYIGVADSREPTVAVDGTTFAKGQSATIDGTTYTVTKLKHESGGGGHGGGGGSLVATIAWTNESARLTTQLDNGSTVSPLDVTWPNQTARKTTTIRDGSTISYNGSDYTAATNASAGTLTLTDVGNASVNTTVSTGDSLTYRGAETTVTSVGPRRATLVWGDPYRVDIANVTDPSNVTSVTFVQVRNATTLATQDPALYNGTVRQNGTLKVTYRANDTNVPVTEYFGPVERETFQEGGTLSYKGNQTTIANVTRNRVLLTRIGSKDHTAELTEGGNVTLASGGQYFSYFPSDDRVTVASKALYDEYDADKARHAAYQTRINGLWAIAILSAIAAIVLLAAAYMPRRG